MTKIAPKIVTRTERVDEGTPDEKIVRVDAASVNGEHVELFRPDHGDAEIVVAGAPYSLAGARRLARTLDQMVNLAQR